MEGCGEDIRNRNRGRWNSLMVDGGAKGISNE